MDLKTLPDLDLVIYTRTQDLKSYSEIVRRYEDKILTYTTLLLGNELSGTEVAIETFVETYKRLNEVSSKLSVSVLLYRVANDLCKKYLKRHGRRDIKEDESVLEELFNIENTEIEFKGKNLVKVFRKALPKLDFRLRDVAILYFVLDLDASLIADILYIPQNAVNVRISESRAKAIKIYGKNN